MRGIVVFVAGIVLGIAVQTGVAQKRTEMYVNHVGIAVPSVPDAVAFYTQKMGIPRSVPADLAGRQTRLGVRAGEQEHVH